jgi:hypothetical protein
MLNRTILKLPVKAKATMEQEHPAAMAGTPAPEIEAKTDRRVRYPLAKSLWPPSLPATPVVASVRHRTLAPNTA